MVAGWEGPAAVLESRRGRPLGACQSVLRQQENANPGFGASCSEGPLGCEQQSHGPGGTGDGEITAGEMLVQEGGSHFIWGTEKSGLGLAQGSRGWEGTGQLHTLLREPTSPP